MKRTEQKITRQVYERVEHRAKEHPAPGTYMCHSLSEVLDLTERYPGPFSYIKLPDGSFSLVLK